MRLIAVSLLLVALDFQRVSQDAQYGLERDVDSPSGEFGRVESIPVSLQVPTQDQEDAEDAQVAEGEAPTLDLLEEEIKRAFGKPGERIGWGERFLKPRPSVEFEKLSIRLGSSPHPRQTKEFYPSQLEKLFGTEENLRTVREATRGRFYLLKVENDPRRIHKSLSDYKRLDDPVELEPKQLRTLSRKFSNARNYGWLAARVGCIPWPGLALEFTCEDRKVTAVFCFDSNIVWFYEDDELVGGKSFTMMRTTIVRILKAAYPNNEMIQRVPRSRGGWSPGD